LLHSPVLPTVEFTQSCYTILKCHILCNSDIPCHTAYTTAFVSLLAF